MSCCGLLGGKLGHSYSPKIHQALGIAGYELFEVIPKSSPDATPDATLEATEAALKAFLQREDLQGLNVTIPYKKTVIKYCASLDASAQKIGSVNTMLRQEDGTWKGYNTDYYGFVYLLKRAGICPKGKKVLVFGNGGSSLTVCTALQDLQAKEILVVSRKGQADTITYADLHKHGDAQILIQTTPVGMYPNNHEALFSLDIFPLCEGVVDLIYNPLRTRLVLEAKQRGIPATGGLPMLVAQAKQASELFQKKPLDLSRIECLTKQLEKQMSNIVLIGMPSCGKTTLAARLSEALYRPFIDTDYEIERRFGESPSSIIASQGEAAFRAYEHDIIVEYSKQSGIILSTGGGVVTRAENYVPLAQQGTIIWIRRALEELADEDRILSQQQGIATLYAQRKALYEQFADFVVENDELQKTLFRILEVCA